MVHDSEMFGAVDHPLSRKFKTSTSNQDLLHESNFQERSKSREEEVQYSQSSKRLTEGSRIGKVDFAEKNDALLPGQSADESPAKFTGSREEVDGTFSQ